MVRLEKLVGMMPRGVCGLAVQLPLQFATCASAGWHAYKNADTIAAAARPPHNVRRSPATLLPRPPAYCAKAELLANVAARIIILWIEFMMSLLSRLYEIR